MKTLITVLALFVFALCAVAQTADPSPDLPSHFVAFGAGVQINAVPQDTNTGTATKPRWSRENFSQPTGFITVGIRTGGSVYALQTTDITPEKSSGRVGVGYVPVHGKRSMLMLLGDGGISTGRGSTVGSYSLGALVMTEIKPGFYIFAGYRSLKLSGVDVTPSIEGGFGKSWQ